MSSNNLFKKDDNYWKMYKDYKNCHACGFVWDYGCEFTLHTVSMQQIRMANRFDTILGQFDDNINFITKLLGAPKNSQFTQPQFGLIHMIGTMQIGKNSWLENCRSALTKIRVTSYFRFSMRLRWQHDMFILLSTTSTKATEVSPILKLTQILGLTVIFANFKLAEKWARG